VNVKILEFFKWNKYLWFKTNLRQQNFNLLSLKNEINEMISFLISPEPLSVSKEILVRDFQYPQVDMIDIDIDYM